MAPLEEQASPLAPTRLFELLPGMLHRLAERGPVLLVVEDLHWADQSTGDLLGFLVRNLRSGGALVLTYRSDELHRRHPLRPFLAELDRSGRAERLELGRLGRRELAELLAGILDEPVAPALVGEILARSEGDPFFAEELLAVHGEGTKLPSALRDLVLARWRRSRRRRSGCWRRQRWPVPGWTMSCWRPWSARTPSSSCGCCARRSPITCWRSTRPAARTSSATRWCRRRSTTTCCP